MTGDPNGPGSGTGPPRNRWRAPGRGWLIPDAPRGNLQPGTFRLLLASAAALVVLTGIADRLTGVHNSLLLFYLVPVGLVSWFGGVGPGFGISALSAAVWLLSRVHLRASFPGEIPYWNALVSFGIFLVVSYVISMQGALRRLLEREKELSGTDPLTGVLNRRAFGEQVTEEIVRSKRYGRPFSLAYMDLDDFKVVNDRYGHGAGDRLLLDVARTLGNSLRSTDYLGRLGGDEFGILLPETAATAAAAVMGKAQERLAGLGGLGEAPVTFSMGVLTCEKPPESYDQILKLADALMYAAKKQGKNRICREILR